MTRLHGHRPYWLTVAFRVGEILRGGRTRITPADMRYWVGRVTSIANRYRLVREPYSDCWIPGPGTYAAIEGHIARKELAARQLREGRFPSGLPNAGLARSKHGNKRRVA